MLKKTVTYLDFDDEPVTEDLYFNLSRVEAASDVDLIPQFELVKKTFEAPIRNLNEVEKRLMLELVKKVASLSYGERIDNRHFNKAGAWDRFVQTPAYDEFIWSLFDPEPVEAMKFLFNVMPKDAREQGLEEMRKSDPAAYAELGKLRILDPNTGSIEAKSDTRDATVDPQAPTSQPAIEAEDTRPLWVRENRDPNAAETQTMTREQLVQAMKFKTTGSY